MKRIAVFLCFVGLCRAQPAPIIEGELVTDQAMDFSHLTVRLEDSQHQQMPTTAMVHMHGEFRLNGAPDGFYKLSVLDERGNEIISEPVSINASAHHLTIRLPSAGPAPPRGGVSLARLGHKPGRRAIQAAIQAQKLAAAGERDESLAELSRAVALDPQFTDAWNNLGVEYIRAGRYTEAITALQKATALDSGCARCQSNLAMALFRAQRPDEAEVAARRSVQLDPRAAASHYVLGCLLASRGARDEAVQQLKLAESELPVAHQALLALRPAE